MNTVFIFVELMKLQQEGKGHTWVILQWRFSWIVNVLHGQTSEFRARSALIKKEVL